MCEAYTGAGSWEELLPHGERNPHWSRFSSRTCDPMGNPWWSSSRRILVGHCTGSQEECDEEVAAETHDELTPKPIPHPPVPLERGEGRQKS